MIGEKTSLLWDNSPRLIEITSHILDPEQNWLFNYSEEELEVLAPLIWGTESSEAQKNLIAYKIDQARPDNLEESNENDFLPDGTPEELFASFTQQINNWLSQEEVNFIQTSWEARTSRIKQLTKQRDEARAAALAANARQVYPQDGTGALNLALAACAIAPIPEAISIRQEILSKPDTIFYQKQVKYQTEVRALTVSPDGSNILTGTRAGRIIGWDINSEEELYDLQGHAQTPQSSSELPNNKGSIRSLAYSPVYNDGTQYFASGSRDDDAIIWDAATGNRIVKLDEHSNDVGAIAFSPTDQFIATGSSDESMRLWRIGEDESLFSKSDRRGKKEVRAVAFSADGEYLLSGWADKKARLYKVDKQDPENTEELYSLRKSGREPFEVLSVAFSPNFTGAAGGNWELVTGNSDHIALIWDADPGRKKIRHTLEGHQGEVTAVAYSPDGQYILTGSTDKTAMVWEAATGKRLLTLQDHTDEIWTVAFSPDGKYIYTGSRDRTVKTWAFENTLPLHNLGGHSDKVNAVAFSPNGSDILTGSDDKKAKVWNASNGALRFTLDEHDGEVTAVTFSPDGKYIATGSKDDTVMVWDATNGNHKVTLEGHATTVISVKFSPDSREILSVSGEFVAIKWPVDEEKWQSDEPKHSEVILGYVEESPSPSNVAFSPDEAFIVTGGDGNIAKVWANPAKERWENDRIYKLNEAEREKYNIDWEY